MKKEPFREGSVSAAKQDEFLARVWSDAAFSARLDRDPKAVLREMGAEVPHDMTVKVVRDSDDLVYLHLPAPPGEGEGEVADADLAMAQGGATFTVFTPMTGTTWSVYATSVISVSVTVTVSVTTN